MWMWWIWPRNSCEFSEKALNSHKSYKNNQWVEIVSWFFWCHHFTFAIASAGCEWGGFGLVIVIVIECDISSGDFLISRLFSIFWEYRSQSRKFWSRKKVSVSVSKIFGLEKKSRSQSRKFWSRKKVSVSVSMKIFGLVTQCLRSNEAEMKFLLWW